MRDFIQICISIGFLLIHLETIAIIQKVSGTFMAWVMLAMPLVAELHLALQSILNEGWSIP